MQDIEADRAGGIASIGTVLGARRTTGFALLAYLVSGLLLLALPWPSTLAAALVLPYLANVVPYLRLDEAECERAHAGWRRFLWLNYLTGFLLTQLIIVVPIGLPGR